MYACTCGSTDATLSTPNAAHSSPANGGCSWRSAKARNVNGTAVDKSEDTTCRIPSGQTMPDVGDVLILGAYNVKADGEIALVRLLDSLRGDGVHAIRVTQVRDNSRCAPMPHYAVTGA